MWVPHGCVNVVGNLGIIQVLPVINVQWHCHCHCCCSRDDDVVICKCFIPYKRYLKPVLHQAEYDPIYRRLYDANAVTSKEVLLM